MKFRKWAVHLNWGYLKKYSWRHKFAFGFLFGPVLCYKHKALVYYRYKTDRGILQDSLIEVMPLRGMMKDAAITKLFDSVPYDFGVLSITTYVDFDIDYNRYLTTVEGFPTLLKEER